ncbi:MAG: 50S ribosomal protein L25 [bacterium]|nr:50S ribosomal protein L25 [bacterium]
MSNTVVLKAEPRASVGKQIAKQLRAGGRLPAVVYGEKAEPIVCSIDRKELETLLHDQGRNAIVSLETGTRGSDSTIIKEIQHDPIRGEILHVDFHRIDLTRKIVVEVRVDSEGIPTGVRNEGGILEHMLHYVEVECLPTEIPERIEVDVTELNIGDNIHVVDLAVDGDAKIVTDPDRTVFAVAAPTLRQTEEEEEVVEGEEEVVEGEEGPQEPEVIERGKREDEEEA